MTPCCSIICPLSSSSAPHIYFPTIPGLKLRCNPSTVTESVLESISLSAGHWHLFRERERGFRERQMNNPAVWSIPRADSRRKNTLRLSSHSWIGLTSRFVSFRINKALKRRCAVTGWDAARLCGSVALFTNALVQFHRLLVSKSCEMQCMKNSSFRNSAMMYVLWQECFLFMI